MWGRSNLENMVARIEMAIRNVIAELDNEITRLTQARALLLGTNDGNYSVHVTGYADEN